MRKKMAEKENRGLGMMLFKLQGFTQRGDAKISDFASEGAGDFPESVAVSVRFDDGQNVRLSGMFPEGPEIFEKAVRTELDP